MVRRLSGVFGVGLVILGFSEFSLKMAPWLPWFDFLGAVGAFGLAAGLDNYSSHSARIGGPIAMALYLFALGSIALSKSAATPSSICWIFGFAGAFLLTGLGAIIRRKRPSIRVADHTITTAPISGLKRT